MEIKLETLSINIGKVSLDVQIVLALTVCHIVDKVYY
jgi:hypothetical protein